MSTVKDILDGKSNNHVWVIKDSDAVFEAIKLMSNKNIGALIVVDSNETPIGIITERDYSRKVILKNRTSISLPVKDIMSRLTALVNPSFTAEDCMMIMTQNKIRHLPVLEQEELIGLVSMGDIVKTLITDREFLIDQFVYYIHGSQNIDTSSVYRQINT